jgi:hypothetical protein
MHIIFRLENLNGRHHLKDTGVDESIILELILGKEDRKVWIACIWSSGGLL